MKTIIVLAALLGVAFGTLRSRLDSQEVRLNKLTAKVQSLSDILTRRSSTDAANAASIDALNGILNRKFGDGCEEGHFQCGNDCVSNLAVCDGNNDCSNGEDESRCDNPVTDDSVWNGVLVYDYCTTRKPDTLTLFISSVSVNVRADVEVSMAIAKETENGSNTAYLSAPGYYDFAERRLVVKPPEDDGLGVLCKFDRGVDTQCTGYVVRIATLAPCAKFIFTRQ